MRMDFKGIKQIAESGPSQYRVTIKVKSKIDNAIVEQRDRKKYISTLEKAIQVRDDLIAEAQREVARREFLGSTLGQIIEDWEAGVVTGRIFTARQISKTTLDDYSDVLRNYARDWWNRPASEISSSEIAQRLHYIHFEKGRSRGVQLKLRSALNTIYEWAISSGRIRGIQLSPAKDVALFGRKHERQKPILNLQQIKKLLEAAVAYGHSWYPIWLFCLHTGARSGEAMALEWGDIDLENRRLFINKSYSGRVRKIGPTKAGYWREVPINDELARLLKELRAKQSPASDHVLPRLKSWDRGAQARILREFCKLIGIPEINFHALRACFATQLLRNGVEAPRVMRICGWKELSTMQTYIRLAGVEITGVTDSLKFTSPDEAVAKVVSLFGTVSQDHA
jgi:integrase